MTPEDTQKIFFQIHVRDDGSYLIEIIIVQQPFNSDLITEIAQLLCVQGRYTAVPMTVLGILWYIPGSIEHIWAERRGEVAAAAAMLKGGHLDIYYPTNPYFHSPVIPDIPIYPRQPVKSSSTGSHWTTYAKEGECTQVAVCLEDDSGVHPPSRYLPVSLIS